MEVKRVPPKPKLPAGAFARSSARAADAFLRAATAPKEKHAAGKIPIGHAEEQAEHERARRAERKDEKASSVTSRSIMVFSSPPGGVIDDSGAFAASLPYSSADDGLVLTADSGQPGGLSWLPGGGGGILPPAVTLTRIVYVNKGGNDSTGTGTIVQPYFTIAKALLSITDSSAGKAYTISVGPGSYPDALALKPWVGIIGAQPSGSDPVGVTNITTPAVSITLDSSWNTANAPIAWFSFLLLVNGMSLTFPSGSSGSSLNFLACSLLGNMTFSATTIASKGSVTFADTVAAGTAVTLNECDFRFLSSTIASTGTVSMTSTLGLNTFAALSGGLECNVAATSSGSGAIQGLLTGVSVTGSLTLTGLFTQFLADAIGYPQVVILNGGAIITPFTRAPSIGYLPGVSNWQAPAPTNVQQALDRMASKVVQLNGGVLIP